MMRKSVFLVAFLILQTIPGWGATFVQTTVTQNVAAGTFDFELVWATSPDFFTIDSVGRIADQARFQIYSPIGWQGPAYANSYVDYTIFIPGILGNPVDQISVYSHYYDGPGLLVGTQPFAQNGSVVDFSIPIDWINEPPLWNYSLLIVNYGRSDQQYYLGTPNGMPDNIYLVPEPSTWVMLLLGFVAVSLAKKFIPKAPGRAAPAV